jgi:hypothetical protein
MFFNVSHDIPCLRVFLSHFSHISDFLPYSRSYSVNFSFFKFFRITCHISRPTVCVSHFHDFQFFRHIPGPIVFMSHFPRLSLFSPYSIFLQCVCLIFPVFLFSCHIQILQCTYLIFHVFHCFLSCSRSYHVNFSVFSFPFLTSNSVYVPFSPFLDFLAIYRS